jgi:predicted nucleic acid-binding protein
MDAFDADVLIYAAVPDHPLGRRVRALFPSGPTATTGSVAGVGSVLLIPELLTKPTREGVETEVEALAALLARLDLRPADEATAELATALGATYGLRAIDAVHLATAVSAGADRFITDNSSDFGRHIKEIDVTHPGELPEPLGPAASQVARFAGAKTQRHKGFRPSDCATYPDAGPYPGAGGRGTR